MGESIYGRPELSKDMGRSRFLEFYYLETELADFCRKNGLDSTGGKWELTERIAEFLGGGKPYGAKFVLKHETLEGDITDDSPIEKNFSLCDKHMEYFKAAIGPEFSMFDDFLIWLESSAGKTYGEAISIWFLIRDDLGLY